MMPGYIGGDRMASGYRMWAVVRKCFPAIGRRSTRPSPRRCGCTTTRRSAALRHDARREGCRDGGSPQDDCGRNRVPHGAAEERRPKVQTGGIEVDGRWYYDDALIPHATQRVLVRYAKWAPDVVILVRDRARPGLPQYALVRQRRYVQLTYC